LDGWTSPTGKSLWNFVIYLDNGRDILWKIHDFSDTSHTANFLTKEIEKVLVDIGIEKFVGIVTDAGSNINLARKQISQKYLHILNIRCIAHSLNLITKDLIKHPFASKIIQYCKVLVTYFKKSHLPNNLLESKISEINILGGGLKTYIDTRWTTVYEMLKSVYQLEICLKEVK
jgi:hypothetical protein